MKKENGIMNNLIYGKDPTERVVSIEMDGSDIICFIQDENGNILQKTVKNELWILCDEKIDKYFFPLEGDLHYKYIKTYYSKTEFQIDRRKFTNAGFDIYNHWGSKEQALLKSGVTYFKGMKHGEVSILSFDLETLGLNHDKHSDIIIISNTLRKNGVITRKTFCYDEYENTGEMLKDWCKWVREEDPSIMLGHNINMYDLPYMIHVAKKYGVNLYLGRDGSSIEQENYERRFRKDQTQFYTYNKHSIYGREIIDTLFLAIKYDVSRKYPSYGLKPIIEFEGLEAENRQHYDASKIRHNYKIPSEWAKIKSYAEFDADDSLALYDLMSPSFFYMTQSVPRTFQAVSESATGSLINGVMTRSYLQDGHSIAKPSQSKRYEGAIAIGNAGIYNNVFKIDVASLYPSIILSYEVYDKEKDPKRHFYELVKIFTERRLKHKKLAKTDKYYDDLQSAEKIFINSCYGFLGTGGLNYNSPDLAAFVTEKGREILKKSISWAEDNGCHIVNADTDSIAFVKDGQVEISPEEQEYMLKDINSLFPKDISWEDDGYYKKIIVMKAKNYILYDGVKTKEKGSALKSSSKEIGLKEFCSKIIDAMLHDRTNYEEIYNEYVREIYNMKDISRWCSKKTVTDKVLNPQRTNEAKIKAAIGNKNVFQGDKVYVFFKEDSSLCLVENFNGDYNKDVLLEKLFKTSKIFSTVLDTDTLFLNLKLKRNKDQLEKILGESNDLRTCGTKG